jgi:hypothetical protein
MEISFGNKITENKQNNYIIYNITNIFNFLHNVKIWKGPSTLNGKFSIYNREKNEAKVNEILKSILENKLAINFIHISEIYDANEKKYILRCWDGQHRWHAIRKYYKEGHPIDISHMFYCIIYKNDTDEGALDKFINHNMVSPSPLPDLTSYEPLKLKRIEIVKELIEFIINKFPRAQSLSNRPMKGYYNVNKLYYILYDFIEENNLENKSIKFIKMKIMEHNNKLKDFYNNQPRSTNIIRAINNNCFLFLLEDFTTSMDIKENVQIEI